MSDATLDRVAINDCLACFTTRILSIAWCVSNTSGRADGPFAYFSSNPSPSSARASRQPCSSTRSFADVTMSGVWWSWQPKDFWFAVTRFTRDKTNQSDVRQFWTTAPLHCDQCLLRWQTVPEGYYIHTSKIQWSPREQRGVRGWGKTFGNHRDEWETHKSIAGEILTMEVLPKRHQT